MQPPVWDKNKTRLQLITNLPGGSYNWFFIPGGAGVDSRCLHDLMRALDLPGKTWSVDFPGNGDNFPTEECFDCWQDYLLELVQNYEQPIIVGHSFGAMLALQEPKHAQVLRGLVAINSTPRPWLEARAKILARGHLPDFSAIKQVFFAAPSDETFRQYILAAAPHLFTAQTAAKGYALFKDIPYNYRAFLWALNRVMQDPASCTAKWTPENIPMLALCGEEDWVTPAELFENDPRFHRNNIKILTLKGASHFCWFEAMTEVKLAMHDFVLQLKEGNK